jgi:hypothetical protein
MRRVLIRGAAKLKAGVQDLANLSEKKITDKVMDQAYDDVLAEYIKLGGSDQAAKGVDLEKFVNGSQI